MARRKSKHPRKIVTELEEDNNIDLERSGSNMSDESFVASTIEEEPHNIATEGAQLCFSLWGTLAELQFFTLRSLTEKGTELRPLVFQRPSLLSYVPNNFSGVFLEHSEFYLSYNELAHNVVL